MLAGACLTSSTAVEENDELRVFLGELQRKTSQEFTEGKLWQKTRQSWCDGKVKVLSEEGRHLEGVVESLRSSIRQLESQDDKVVLAEVKEVAGLHISTQLALLEKLRERLHLGGGSSSALHRFATAVRQHCDLGQESHLKVLEDRLDLLQSSSEAMAEDFRGEVSPQVNFLQVGQVSGHKERSDRSFPLLSLFRSERQPSITRIQDASDESLPAMPDDERPKVLELMARLHQENTATSSKEATWCAEERQRQQSALQRSNAAAEASASAAKAEAEQKAALEDHLSHLQKGLQLCQEAREVFEQDASSNSTEVAVQHQRDRQLAVKVLEKALGAAAGAKQHRTAQRYLTALQQSFQEEPDPLPSSATLVLQRGAELQTALETEQQKLMLHRDFHAKRQRRHEELEELHVAQAKSVEAEIKSLEDCGAPRNQWKAEVHALQDAELVFAGEPLVAPPHMRGARGAKLSAMEEAAEALGIAVN